MNIKQNEPLAKYTTFKIGGIAKYFIVAKSKDEMVEALNYAFSNKIKYFILGGGANVLFKDEIFDGMVIKNETRNIKINRNMVEVESGAPMNLVVAKTIEEKLGGLEYFAGHPGTIGGSVYINAHTKNQNLEVLFLGDKLVSAEIFDLKKHKREIVNNSYFNFSYDFSSLKITHDILLAATFKLEEEDQAILEEKAAWIKNYRMKNQDYGGFTAGCIFQNPKGQIAGILIDKCGLKGLKYGGAKISVRHANFFVNESHAKASDVLYLINYAKNKVKEKFGVELKEEIVIV